MSFSVCVYLYCDGNLDGCECQVLEDGEPNGFCEASSGDSSFTTKKDYKDDAKKRGWVFRGHKAYCPNCFKVLKEG